MRELAQAYYKCHDGLASISISQINLQGYQEELASCQDPIRCNQLITWLLNGISALNQRIKTVKADLEEFKKAKVNCPKGETFFNVHSAVYRVLDGVVTVLKYDDLFDYNPLLEGTICEN